MHLQKQNIHSQLDSNEDAERITQAMHSTYRKNNNHEKWVGIGLNGFIFKKINENYCIKEKKDPGSRLGIAC